MSRLTNDYHSELPKIGHSAFSPLVDMDRRPWYSAMFNYTWTSETSTLQQSHTCRCRYGSKYCLNQVDNVGFFLAAELFIKVQMDFYDILEEEEETIG